MRKVGIIITRMVAGGASNVVRALLRRGAGRFEFILLTGPEDVRDGELDDLKEYCDIRVVPEMRRSISPLRDFRAYLTLRREIRGLDLDLVHTHTSKAGVLGRFAAYAEKVPAIIHSTHGSIYDSGSGIDGVPDAMGLFKRLLLASERAAGRRCDFLTVLSERERRSAVALSLAPEARIKVVPNGVEPAEFAVDAAARSKARSELGVDDEFVLLSVGRLSSEKGHSVLLDAFAEFAAKVEAPVRLTIVGDGPEMGNLKRKAAELAGVDLDPNAEKFGDVFFAGRSDDVRGFLAAADLFVLPSLYEGFGIVLLEAMAAGVPILATDTGGVPDVVSDGVDGVLVPPGDSSSLAEAIAKLAANGGLRDELAAAALEKVAGYTVEKMVEGYFTLYDACFA